MLENQFFFVKELIFPKTHGNFPEVGQKQKTERKEEEERLNDGDNNGQATHGARKLPGQNIGENQFSHTGVSPKLALAQIVF